MFFLDTAKENRKNCFLHLMRIGAIFVRNHLNQPFYRKDRDKKIVAVVKVLYQVPDLLLKEDACREDEEFLNSTLMPFYEKFKYDDSSLIYNMIDLLTEVSVVLINEKKYSIEIDNKILDFVNNHRDRQGYTKLAIESQK